MNDVIWYITSDGRMVFEREHEYYMRNAKPHWTYVVMRLLDRYYHWLYRRAYRRAIVAIESAIADSGVNPPIA